MALFDDRLAQEITMQVRQRYLELGAALGEPCTHEDLDQSSEPSALQHDLRLLIGVANGEYHRTDETVRLVEPALARVLDLLVGNALHSKARVPDDFWKTDIGIVTSRVRWWISVDDLITISNAAALAFGENTQANRMRIGRAIENGLLDWIPDPSVANPQQNKRVLRPQVERLRDQRRLPE
ncbi:MAG: hypothetical protein ACXVDA_14630 [Ktedonobacterales bacterium]